MQDGGQKMCGLKLDRRLAASKSSSSLSDARTRPLFFPAGFLPVAFAAAFLGVGLFEAAFFAGVFFRGGCSSALLTTFAVSAAVFCFLAALLGGSSCTGNPVPAREKNCWLLSQLSQYMLPYMDLPQYQQPNC